jgi:hypothetical protein
MNSSRRHAKSALKILIPVCFGVGFGPAHAAGSLDVAAGPLTAVAVHAPRTALDLRVPDLRRVMSRSQLLAEMGSPSDEEELIEIVAAPALAPMSFDAQAPLGIIDSLRWSVDHPTQVWRVLLPATVTP